MTAQLNASKLVARVAMALGAVVLLVIIASLAGGGSYYALKLTMSDASGLRPGSQVLLGGVSVGTVSSLDLDSHDHVIASLHLDPSQVHVGRGVSVRIVGANLLGEKYAALSPGDSGNPLADGTILPASATTTPTDLDQIVNVLDGSTRARLATLLSEAGMAVAGRQSDVRAILRQLPLSLTAATSLLTELVQDNHTLGDLVSNSDRFVTRVNTQSGDLRQAIDATSGAVTTLALRADQLRQAVAGAPQTLSTLNGFLVQGTRAVSQLTPAAGAIADTAPELHQLLMAVKPFTNAAVPTLNRAASVAPLLTRLANHATPTIRTAVPTVRSLENVAKLAKPASAWIGLSAADLFGIFNGWSRAIQFRDGLSHVFNGDIYLDPSIVLNAANAGASADQKCQNLLDVLQPGLLAAIGKLSAADRARKIGCRSAQHDASLRSTPSVPQTASTLAQKLAGTTSSATSNARSTIQKALGGLGTTVGNALSGTQQTVQKTVATVGALVGKVLAAPTPGSSTGTASSDKAPGNSLQSLLNYLLGK